MAKELITRYVDDLNGGPAERTVTFAWGGTHYEIDLSKDNITALERLLAPYVKAGRKAGRTAPAKAATRSAPRAKPAAAALDLPTIREWARTSGFNIAERGRIAAATVEAYNASLTASAADARAVASQDGPDGDLPGQDVPVSEAPERKPRAKKAGRPAKRTAAAAREPKSSATRPRRTRPRTTATPPAPVAADRAVEESTVASA